MATFTFSMNGFAQRIVVKNADGTMQDSRQQNSNRAYSHPLAVKLHLNNVLFGEYMASVEYALSNQFSLEGGVGFADFGNQILVGRWNDLLDLPSAEYESAGQGFSYLIEARMYQVDESLEEGTSYGLGLHRTKYLYYQTFDQVKGDYESSSSIMRVYGFYGLGWELGDHLLLQINMDLGLKLITEDKHDLVYSSVNSQFEAERIDNEDVGVHVGFHVTLAYVFR